MTGTPLLPYVRIWAAAADPKGIWLISENEQGEADGWLEGPLVRLPGEPIRTVAHRTVREALRTYGELDTTMDIHSGSWVEEGDMIVLDYLAVCGGFGLSDMDRGAFTYVPEIWPWARPFTPADDDALGQPPPHGPNEQPDPRYFDVFRQQIHHLSQLRNTNSIVRAALDEHWHRHLDTWTPRLAGQYEYGQELRTA